MGQTNECRFGDTGWFCPWYESCNPPLQQRTVAHFLHTKEAPLHRISCVRIDERPRTGELTIITADEHGALVMWQSDEPQVVKEVFCFVSLCLSHTSLCPKGGVGGTSDDVWSRGARGGTH